MKLMYHLYVDEYRKRRKDLENAFQKRDINKTISYLRYLTNFLYESNYKFTDDFLEDVTQDISKELLGETIIRQSNKKTVLFYDGFGLICRGLADIYVKALAELGYEVIYVLGEWTRLSGKFQELYGDTSNIRCRRIKNGGITNRMKELQEIILEISPATLFLYTQPSDVAGVGTFSTICGEQVTRYLIDLTDHAYWLGRCAVDYFIGFRNWGYNLSIKYRNIVPEKYIILPFYPDERTSYSFEGLPSAMEGKEFVFSGGNIDKIQGSKKYEKMVEHILTVYPDVNFLYAGNGTNKVLERLKKRFSNRFFIVNERKDLDEIFSRAKFYLSTYPIGGGLMLQFALKNKCIPLTLSKHRNGFSDLNMMLLYPEEVNIVFYNTEELYEEMDRIMRTDGYCEKVRQSLGKQVIEKEKFQEQLELILKNHVTEFVGTTEDIYVKDLLQTFRKKATYKKYCNIIFSSRNENVYKSHPMIVRKMQRLQKKKAKR